jgi:uncharacterized membrane protein
MRHSTSYSTEEVRLLKAMLDAARTKRQDVTHLARRKEYASVCRKTQAMLDAADKEAS